jgi:cytochrome c-type biogenesis protein CcmF
MIPELGQFALILALFLALAQGILPLIGAARGEVRLMRVGHFAASGQFVFVLLAFVCLAASFLASDFSVKNVAINSNTQLPTHYKFTATWGSHEGSMLLWVLMQALWTLAVTAFGRRLPAPFLARVQGVLGLLSAGFLLFILITSDPFERLLPSPAEGRDLNPLLQDPGMVYHPPMLYMGYVGFSVAFAFAVAALIEGRFDSAWARFSRPWTTAAWCFLTLGICLGSAWAYYELGWGGWWFWDPVENASFMPWLAGTALIHSLAVTEKRGAFKSWTLLLAILAFSLSLLGTFLVRSGVLTSVHAFATDPKRGVFILGLLVLVIGGSLTLYAARAARIGLGGRFDPISRESMLLANNVLLAVALGAVLLGTLYPLFLDALGQGKISVGPPYFEAVFAPLMAPAIFLMAVGPAARWKSAPLPDLWQRLRWALGVAVAAGLLLPLAAGQWKWGAAAGLALAFWVIAAAVAQLAHRLQQSPGPGWRRRLMANSASYYGMLLAHVGVAVFIIGVTLVTAYEAKHEAVMKPNDQASVAGYGFTFLGTREVKGPNYSAVEATITVRPPRGAEFTLKPQRRVYAATRQAMTEADIDSGVTRDVLVNISEQDAAGGFLVAMHVKPFVDWIWLGCVLMALGGVLAISDRRYRLLRQRGVNTVGSAALTGTPGVAEGAS